MAVTLNRAFHNLSKYHFFEEDTGIVSKGSKSTSQICVPEVANRIHAPVNFGFEKNFFTFALNLNFESYRTEMCFYCRDIFGISFSLSFSLSHTRLYTDPPVYGLFNVTATRRDGIDFPHG